MVTQNSSRALAIGLTAAVIIAAGVLWIQKQDESDRSMPAGSNQNTAAEMSKGSPTPLPLNATGTCTIDSDCTHTSPSPSPASGDASNAISPQTEPSASPHAALTTESAPTTNQSAPEPVQSH